MLRQANLDWLQADSADIVTQLDAGMSRIQQIVAQLHHYSVLGQSATLAMPLTQLLSHVLHNYQAGGLADIEVTQQVCDAWVEVHSTEMVTALSHIFDNAVKAKPSKISICCRRLNPQQVSIEIEDDGDGMSADVLSRVFDPFFTTRDVGAGRGLGLTVGYAVVRQHGGQIEFQSEPGHGTVCKVTLPCVNSPEPK
jgi:signal transduction histidine kinase